MLTQIFSLGGQPFQSIQYRMRILWTTTDVVYEIIIPRKGIATCDEEWANEPIREIVPLIRTKLLDSTKKRAPLSPSPQTPTAEDGAVRQNPGAATSAIEAQHIEQENPSTETEVQRHQQQRNLKQKAKSPRRAGVSRTSTSSNKQKHKPARPAHESHKKLSDHKKRGISRKRHTLRAGNGRFSNAATTKAMASVSDSEDPLSLTNNPLRNIWHAPPGFQYESYNVNGKKGEVSVFDIE